MFHVSQLKPFYGSPVSSEIVNFPSNGQEPQAYICPLAILNNRTVTVDGQIKNQLLVQRTGLPVEESSREDATVIQEVFPHFNLEDQVCFDEGRNVTDLTTKKIHKEEEAESGMAADGNTGRVRKSQHG